MALQATTMALADKDQRARLELGMELFRLHLTIKPMDKGVTPTFVWTMVVYSRLMRPSYSHSGEHLERKRRQILRRNHFAQFPQSISNIIQMELGEIRTLCKFIIVISFI